MELRPYQKEAVAKGVEHLKTQVNPGIISISTGGGKSHVIAGIANEINEPILVLQPTKEILQQNYNKMRMYGFNDIKIYSASFNSKEIGKFTYATIGSIYRHPEPFKHFKYVLLDECFTSETEILTDKGFINFDKLNKKEKIAQWDNGNISFVKPLKYIERKHDGEMISFHIKHNINILMTPNHNQIFINKNNIIKKEIKNAKFGNDWKIPVSGISVEKNEKLTSLERLYIATQADGSIHKVYKDYTTVAFTFTKDRKIVRIKKILFDCNIKYSEVKHSNRHAIRIMVKMPKETTKDITKHIKYPMGYGKAKEIIEEMVEWDGYRIPSGQYYYSSKDKKQSDFYAQVAVLAGHRCYQSIQKDNRKSTYSDVHKLFIILNKQTDGTRRCYINKVNFKGNVYCVSVPSGAIVLRHGGFIFISGNCHCLSPKNVNGMYNKFFRAIGHPRIVGLTATPYRIVNKFIKKGYDLFYTGHLQMLNRIHPFFFKQIIYKVENHELIEQGYLAKPNYEFPDPDFDYSEIKMNTTGNDFDKNSLDKYTTQPMRLKKVLYSIAKHYNDRKYFLVFASSVRQANEMSTLLRENGFENEVVFGHTPPKERDRIIEDFRSGKNRIVLNVGVLTLGFDFPELDCIVLARPTISLALFYQMVGRGFRPHPNKENFLVVDCTNTIQKLGRPETIVITKEDDGFRDRVETEAGVITNKPLFIFRIKDKEKKEQLLKE